MIKNKTINTLIELALNEDIVNGDCTSNSTIEHNKKAKACFTAKDNGIIAGMELIPLIINIAKRKKYIRYSLKFLQFVKDGVRVKKEKVIAEIHGTIKDILLLERTMLNFLSRTSGIATYTFGFVNALGKSRVYIYDTRKTLPAWRLLDKYAVTCGRGRNHRMNMGDQLLIKDNHWQADKQGVLSYL
ncbi:nicotinate-nucleotide diphosphorylase (carboxylating), partial [bacterium]